MSAATILLLIALALALWAEFEAKGRSVLGWSVILTIVALLVGRL